jgi:6-phosphogluconolactonase
MTREIEIVPDPVAFERRAVERFEQAVRQAVQARGRAVVALSGGSTPRDVYRRLSGELALPWDRIELFFGDERPVPPTDKDSNFRMAKEALFDPLAQQGKSPKVHRVEAEKGAAEAARRYEAELKRVLGEAMPQFDLVLLGLGPDGHTASLFPGTAGLEERSRWVIANRVEKLATDRITFSYPLINRALEALFLVRGADKADAVSRVLDLPDGPIAEIPSRGVRAQKVTWLLDAAAVAKASAARSP